MTQMGDSIRRRSGGRAKRPAGRRPSAGDGKSPGGLGGVRGWLRWIVGGAAGAGLAFLIGWLVATQIIFPKPALAGDEVAVPDLAGMRLDRARTELESARLELGSTREMAHPREERGVVIAQDPVAGQRLRPGAQVRVAVSRGRPRVMVPNLVGMPGDAAVELARRVGFEPERLEEPTVEEAGIVLRTRPEAGGPVELPARLTVVVSAGGLAPPEPAEPAAPAARDTGLVEGGTAKLKTDEP